MCVVHSSLLDATTPRTITNYSVLSDINGLFDYWSCLDSNIIFSLLA